MVDAEKRLNIDQILRHRWIQLSGPDSEFNRLMKESSLDATLEETEATINELLVEHMSQLPGFSREKVVEVRYLEIYIMIFRNIS